MKAAAGLSSTSVWKGEKEIGKLFLRSKTTKEIITDTTEKANNLNSYYASVFSCNRNSPEIKLVNPVETFIINIRKSLAKIRKNKSVGPDEVPGEILKLGGVAMTPS